MGKSSPFKAFALVLIFKVAIADLQVYKLAELEHATNNFAKELGEGMYAKVYEGRLRHTSVAVKVFLQHGQDGELEDASRPPGRSCLTASSMNCP